MLAAIQGYIKTQVTEIDQDRTLSRFGAILAITHCLTAGYWLQMNVAEYLARGSEAICWPFWESCSLTRVFSSAEISAFLYLFLLAAIMNVWLFLTKRTTQGYFALFFLNVAKVAFILLDFRLRTNHHIMSTWMIFAFLLVSNKKSVLQFLIVAFYFWAGLLKLNSEWLSGSALYGELWLIHGPLVKWACAYVIVLELVMVWALVWTGSWISWLALGQFILFHIYSFAVVGFFYPLLMFAFLSLFLMIFLERESKERSWKLAHALPVVLAFSLFQIHCKLMPGDTALTGEGRLFALHMFDSWTQCDAHATLKYKNGRSELKDLHIPLPIRLHCDPIVYSNRARNLCSKYLLSGDSEIQNIDLSLRSRRSNQPELQTIVDIKDFCGRKVHYSWLFHNDWINTSPI
jgi:hypothetical protein